ncbi:MULTISPECIES: glycosyltransferase family 39 protein [unclassified Thioalkalivibrio]|uniref:glycosyltransferase family 39 protein n=1 Tax=unclassified Thioalkalivibrio TaxID=2621013 RepID=UPI0003713BC1|nr:MULTISPECIES: glycosyltransferase family 39 protein [unclassified Thioalkalivibrio]
MSYTSIPFTFMELLLAGSFLMLVLVAVLWTGRTREGYLWPLLAAFGARIGAALVQRFLSPLPQGGADAISFERRAWFWAQSGCGNLGDHFSMGSSYLHSWLIANVYACADRAPLAFQAVNIALGMLTVYLIARIAEQLWDRQAAVRAAWIAALFPILIVNAAVPLREVWFTAFFLLGVLWLVRWVQSQRTGFLVAAVGVLLASAIVHGAAVFAIAGIAVVLVGWSIREFLRAADLGRIRPGLLFGGVLLGSAGVMGFLVMDDMRFSSIGQLGDVMEQTETLDQRAERSARGGAAYPSFLIPSNDLQALVLTPIRMGYLLFGPPLWEVRSPVHLVGMLEGLFYLSLVLLLALYRHHWWQRQDFRLLVVIFVVLTIIFAWGTSNFGTAARHRAKFLGILIALAAGLAGRHLWRRERLQRLTGGHQAAEETAPDPPEPSSAGLPRPRRAGP